MSTPDITQALGVDLPLLLNIYCCTDDSEPRLVVVRSEYYLISSPKDIRTSSSTLVPRPRAVRAGWHEQQHLRVQWISCRMH